MKENRKGRVVALVVILAVLVIFVALIGFITDFLWFRELGYVSVFFKQLFTQLKIGVPVFIIISILSFIYLNGLKRGYFKKMETTGTEVSSKSFKNIAIGLSALSGFAITYLAVTRLWFEALKFYHATSFNLKDPLYNLDISFYIFKLQFIKDVNELVIYAIIIFAVLTFVYYFILMSLARPKVFETDQEFEEEERFTGEFTEDENIGSSQSPFGNMGGLGDMFSKFTKGFTPQGGATQRPRKQLDGGDLKVLLSIATKQIVIVGVLFFIMIGVNFFLRQFEILYSRTGVVYGAGFTDVNITLWMYRIMVVLALLSAIMFAIGMKKKKYKTMLTVPVIMILVGVLGSGVSLVVENLIVSPNQINKEGQYLAHNIKYTQAAYDLQDVTIEPFAATSDLSKEDIQNNMSTINNIRINDYEPAKKFYNQTQAIRRYYAFNDVDVDRYMINGEYTQTFLSAREIDEEKINQEWLNKYIKYTHGYGITLSRVDKITTSGQPDMLIKDIPPVSKVEEIEITDPGIYFGEMTNSYILVNTDEVEFDYPEGDENKYTEYTGDAGIKLNLFNRTLFSIKEGSMKLFVSSNIDKDSKIIINRNIKERVRKIMPYLEYDSDPYIVTANGKLYWMMDAYTTSSYYPYSEPYNIEASDVNYIRNSIKVVIDAYNGDTNYYLVDDTDPIANTLKEIYPKLFKDFDQMPEELQKHIRYPKDLLNIQAAMYKKYHVNDIRVFYQGEDLWEISDEIFGTETQPMTPQYYIMKMPGEKDVEFINSIPYTPKDKRNLTGLLVARNDGENYGNLVLYQMPKTRLIYGPMQVEAQINQHPQISQDFTLWTNAGSKYSRGNMLIVPIEESLLYVEPVYLEAEDSSLPEVKRVIVAYGDKIAYENTLAESLDRLFGEGSGTPDSSHEGVEPDTDDKEVLTVDQQIQAAAEAFDNAVEAQEAGDWAKYGEELDNLKDALNALQKGQKEN